MQQKIIPGIVIELPRNQKHTCVVVDVTKLSKGWHKVTVLAYNGDVLVLKLKVKPDNKYLYWRVVRHIDSEIVGELY